MNNNQQSYPIDEALKLVKENAKAKFDESVEVHVKLRDSKKKKDDLAIRGVCILPHGSGKTKRVAVFTEDETKKKEAEKSGADIIGGKELVTKIKSSGKADFDIAVATPDFMKALAPIAKILGPRGLMPSPKTETITDDVEKTVKELKAGKTEFKNDKTRNIHQSIGKVSYDQEKLKENFLEFIEAIKKSAPEKARKEIIKNITLCSTMGDGVRVSG